MFKIGAVVAMAIGIVAALTACSTASYIPAESLASSDADGVVTDPGDYVIGAGDGLFIYVFDHPELSMAVTVLPDGKISTPLAQNLVAAGKTTAVLGEDIERALSETVRAPVVTVMVQGAVGDPAQQIRVVGEAAQPQALQFRQGMTVLDVLIRVGGLSQYAAGNRARIMRNVNGEPMEIRVRLADLINSGRMDQNVRMMPGDVLVIPQSIL